MVEMTKKRYTARYRFDDGDWIVEVDEIPQVHTFAKTLAKAQAHIRDALALWLQVEDATTLNIAERYEGLPNSLMDDVARASATRAQASELSDRAQHLTASAARTLIVDLGMSGRDAAQLLGVSHQRVHQLVHQNQARSA